MAIVDVPNERMTDVLTACEDPRSVALTIDFQDLYVTCHGTNQVAVFDASSGEPHTMIEVGRGPTGLTVSEDNRWVFVTNTQEHTVSVINTATWGVKSIASVGQAPTGVVAAGQPIQFRPDTPQVDELPRTGFARTTDPDPLFGAKIGVAAVLGVAPLIFGSV